MSKISVIVPVYKVEPYLAKCVDSILAQTFRDFVLVLVDDGSPDRCGAICDEYAAADSRVKVIHRENGGLSAARNSGIDWTLANSDAEYLTFIDSDDWVSPNYLEELLNGIALGAEVACLSCAFAFGEDRECERFSDRGWRVETAAEYWLDSRTLGHIAWAKLYARRLFEKVRFPEGKLHEDVHTTHLAVFAAEKVAVSEASLYHYRMRMDSIVHESWSPRRLDAIAGLQSQVEYFRDHGFEELAAVSAGRKIAAMKGFLPDLDRNLPEVASAYRAEIAKTVPVLHPPFWPGREYYRAIWPKWRFLFRWSLCVIGDFLRHPARSWIALDFPSIIRLARFERREQSRI